MNAANYSRRGRSWEFLNGNEFSDKREVRRGLPALSVHNQAPDRQWFGNMPEIISEVRGPEVDAIIDRIDDAARGMGVALLLWLILAVLYDGEECLGGGVVAID